jgi:uncharacterized protein
MTKLLVLVLVVVVVLWLMKGRSRGAAGRPAPPPRGGDAASGPQPMVACAHCGVHLPRTEALLLGERTYCCAAHRDAAAARR